VAATELALLLQPAPDAEDRVARRRPRHATSGISLIHCGKLPSRSARISSRVDPALEPRAHLAEKELADPLEQVELAIAREAARGRESLPSCQRGGPCRASRASRCFA